MRCWAWLAAWFRRFAKLLLSMRAWFLRFPKKTVWVQPLAGGLLVGVMGWFVPQVLGVGYGFVGDALNGGMAFRLMLLLLVLKLFAVTTSYARATRRHLRPVCSSAPCWRLGRNCRRIILSRSHRIAGRLCAGRDGAVFAGVGALRCTSVLIIFEMTQDYAVIVPLDDRQSGESLRCVTATA